MQQIKYIFLTGGVVSGLGKGITTASLGRLLKARGYNVAVQKFDPYINIDPGYMSPYQHGEVFVTEDGAETDLDLGHYERFVDENLSVYSNVSAGKIYWNVLQKERSRGYDGATVQIIPHITDAMKDCIYRSSRDAHPDIVISEIGGTVGDIESLPYLEAIRQIGREKGHENVLFVHLTLVPYLSFSGEMKTKPSQHSVKELLSIGIQPDVIVCRTEQPMSDDMRDKLALFCNVDKNCIIENANAESIYDVPLLLEKEHFADIVCEKLKLDPPAPDLAEWREICERRARITRHLEIGLVGKYVQLHDAYLSLIEALQHAGIAHDVNIKIKWIQAETLDGGDTFELNGLSGIIVPGGFDTRGVPGMIQAARFARENKIPYLGIGFGMQCALIEFARNVMGLEDADSVELNAETEVRIIDRMPEHYDMQDKEPPMRLGSRPCKLAKETLIHEAYGEDLIYERHRNRYEVSNHYRNGIAQAGMTVSGLSADERKVASIELPRNVHPWFVGVQFHPEFKSRPTRPSPLIKAFVGACIQGK